MAATAARVNRSGRRPLTAAVATPRSPAVTVGGLALLVLLSVLLRTRRMEVGFWIDEALSVGIADRPLLDIPGTLRLDGSPPLYYLILHGWMRLAGTGEAATHALSLIFAVAAIPVAWALTRRLFGERAAWVCAALTATTPFLTQYAQETRMYSLVVLIGTVATATFVGAFALRLGRAWTWGFAASLAALLYIHNWSLFFGAGCGLAWLWLCWHTRDRTVVREGLFGFGAALLAYAPWIPSLAYQAAHTGAPWAQAPAPARLLEVPLTLLRDVPAAVLLVGAAGGIAALWRERGRAREMQAIARAVVAMAIVTLATVVLAWLTSQVSPAWATRYLAVAVAPVLLLAAVAVSRGGLAGALALLVTLGVWIAEPGPRAKSNVRDVAAAIEPSLAPGDLVISTQPEQLPAVAYYLDTPGLRWATLTGLVDDVGVTDWRDGPERLAATTPERDLLPLLDALPPGGRVALVQPQIADLGRWSAPWTKLVRIRSSEWEAAMRRDRRFRVVAVRPMVPEPLHPNPLEATVFVRSAMR